MLALCVGVGFAGDSSGAGERRSGGRWRGVAAEGDGALALCPAALLVPLVVLCTACGAVLHTAPSDDVGVPVLRWRCSCFALPMEPEREVGAGGGGVGGGGGVRMALAFGEGEGASAGAVEALAPLSRREADGEEPATIMMVGDAHVGGAGALRRLRSLPTLALRLRLSLTVVLVLPVRLRTS